MRRLPVPMNHPLVTIVTPCYNSAQFIEDTIQSVLAQTYPNIEYIVMDGGSTDGTQAIAERYADRLTLISERDRGQTHAINKGWQRAKGDILAWLNADDLYYPDTVEKAVSYLTAHPETGWVYGKPDILDIHGTPMPYRAPALPWDYNKLLTYGCYITQPTVFMRREVYEKCGDLDETLHYGMDYEYWLRIGKMYTPLYAPDIQVAVKVYRHTKTRGGGFKRFAEFEALLARHGGSGLPAAMHHEWETASFTQLVKDIMTLRWGSLPADLSRLARYPAALPRGVAKAVFLAVIPPRLETQIRRWFMRVS